MTQTNAGIGNSGNLFSEKVFQDDSLVYMEISGNIKDIEKEDLVNLMYTQMGIFG